MTKQQMIKQILCKIGRHDYYIIRRFKGYASAKVGCTRCPRKWAMNDTIQAFVPWDLDFEDMYESFGFKEEA